MREIFAAYFRDRIVHHLVVRELEKIYEPAFIYDSFASRQGKGIHGAVNRLQQFMLKVTKNQKLPAYYLQLDIRSFFMHIDKAILLGLLEKKLAPKQAPPGDGLLYLRNRVVNNLKSRLVQLEQDMVVPACRNQPRLRKIKADPPWIGHLQQVLASYLGHFQHARTTRLVLPFLKNMAG